MASAGSSTARPTRAHGSGRPSNAPASRWAVSGGRAKNSGRPTAEYQPIDRLCYRADGGRRERPRAQAGRGVRAARRLRPVEREAFDRVFRQVPVPDPARPVAGTGPRGHGAAAAGHRSPGSAGRCGDPLGRGRLARDRVARRRGPQGAEGLRDARAGRGPRTRRRQDRADGGRQHHRAPGIGRRRGPEGIGRRRHPDRAGDRPRRRGPPPTGGLRRRGRGGTPADGVTTSDSGSRSAMPSPTRASAR